MTAVGTVTIIWRGGEHPFCLAKAGDIFALEDVCKAGIAEIMHRLVNDQWRLNDVRETIRLALIGGGMEPDRAMTAVKLHVDQNPHGLAPSVVIAYSILSAVLVGVPDDALGKGDAAETEPAQTSSTMTGVSAAAPSTESAPDLDGPQDKPIKSPSGNWPPASKATTAFTAAMTPPNPHL